MAQEAPNCCLVLDIAQWANSRQRSILGQRTDRERPYSLIETWLIRAGEQMEERNELIEDATRLIQKACILIETAIREADPDDHEDSIQWLNCRVGELRALCDFMSPPRPSWPANVVPFVPRRTG